MSTRYVALPKKHESVYLYESDRKTKVRQVLWGDMLHVDAELSGGWLRIRWAPNDADELLYIRASQTTTERPLEIVFVDVGQGDGAVLIAPEPDGTERVMVIDAGEQQNMYDFLSARFGSYGTSRTFHAAIVTHPDEDHYRGFKPIFEDDTFGFDHVFHSGLVERPVSGEFEKLGGKVADPATGEDYVTDLADAREDFVGHFGPAADIGRFVYPGVMRAALANQHVGAFARLGRDAEAEEPVWMPDYRPDDPRNHTIEVLGPVVEHDSAGAPRLRKIGAYGETKNGHSVILKLTIGDFRILFGGDLNDKAEKFLLQHYTGRSSFPSDGSQDYEDLVADASSTFRADVMKACHHGSEKVTDAFLRAVNAAAFVVSSGDQEGHIHPRPDLLGRLGTFGRGKRPVILSTELQRSTRAREDQEIVDALMADVREAAEGPPLDADAVTALEERIQRLGRTNVAVWGSIYVKTDGRRLITAFKVETASEKKKWFYYEYAWNEAGLLELVDG